MLAALAVTLATAATQAVAVPATGFFADPVVAVMLRILSIVLSVALSGTIILACIKMIAYFGAEGQARKQLSEVVREAGDKFEEFAREMRTLWQTHDRAITELQANHKEHERRIDGHDEWRAEVDRDRRFHNRRADDRKD